MAKLKEVSPARRTAFDILRQVEGGAFSSVLLAADQPNLQPPDRALCHELVLGVLRWQLHLDKIVEYCSKRKTESLDLAVRIALRLGLYQLRFLSRIPARAAVNESVSLARWAGVSSAAAFVNAVLRRSIREAEYDPALEAEDPLEKISAQTSHPVWLIDRWARSFGLAEAESFARANNLLPPIAFRVVSSRTNQQEVLARLTSAGASLESSVIAEQAWRVSGAPTLLRELAAAGQIYLQDEASQLVAQVMAVRPGDRVLDLCAAPGGKTTLLADRSANEVIIVAADRSARRMATVVRTAQLHQLKGLNSVILDAAATLPFETETFDRVLVDAPCSGTGTLRRNPEIRWRLTAEDIVSLSVKQGKILRRAADVVKPGGFIVYSTCSVESEENEEVIEDFLESDARFRPAPIRGGSGTIRTWPHREGSDGFFIAGLERLS